MVGPDLRINIHTGLDDDLCKRCRGIVLASLYDADLETEDDEENFANLADNLTDIGEQWDTPKELE
jgi:hypothetical protein